jgi:hypothetical protein
MALNWLFPYSRITPRLLNPVIHAGNDFFRECGDVFACHHVDHPDEASELLLLAAVAPRVPTPTVQSLQRLFRELRTPASAADEKTSLYPYSTRELLNIVRHLQVRVPRVAPAVRAAIVSRGIGGRRETAA